MESLSEEAWDVVIAGTSLPQSLLALALSRSDKKVLHVDRNGYYGGEDAGFSLQDARAWTEDLNARRSPHFSDAVIDELPDAGIHEEPSPLKSSRLYTLSLSPQIIYAQSKFLPSLVSSQIHSQLEFLAVGSWWVYRDGELRKIPSTREDVFSDESLSMRDKRSLMKFLRFVLQEDDNEEASLDTAPPQTLAEALKGKFKMPAALESPILALALCPTPANSASLDTATARIRRHMRSVGYFGPGFGAVIAKYGGSAEISQVACRAQAVGGGTYLLGHGVDAIDHPLAQHTDPVDSDSLIKVKLSDGTEIRSRWVIGGSDDLPLPHGSLAGVDDSSHIPTVHSIDVVSDPLNHLFPATSESGPVPAAAVILVQNDADTDNSPIYLQVHSEDTGECPSGQCVVYGSLQSSRHDARDQLRTAVSKVLQSTASDSVPRSLWSMSYISQKPASYPTLEADITERACGKIVSLPMRPHDVSLQDEILDTINVLWTAIMGTEAEGHSFLRFEEREQEQDTGT